MNPGDFQKRFQEALYKLRTPEPSAPSPEPVAAPAPVAPHKTEDVDIYLPLSVPQQSVSKQGVSLAEKLKIEDAERKALKELHSLGLHFIHGGAYQRTRALEPAEMERLEAMFTKELRKDVGFRPHHEPNGELYVTVVQHKFGNKIASLLNIGPAPSPSASL